MHHTAREFQQPRSRRIAAIVGTATAGLLAAASLAIAGISVVAAQSGEGRTEGGAGDNALLLVPEGASAEQAARRVVSALSEPAPGLPDGMPTAAPAALGMPLDPPTLEEFGYARALAHAAERSPSRRVDGAPGYEFLSLDVPESASAGRRLLEVQSYDYASSELVSQIVDLTTADVTEERAPGARPGPSEREALFAMTLLISSDAGVDVRTGYTKATGEELTNPAQLRFVATSNVPALVRQNVPDCETDRCITFQGRSSDGVLLPLSQIVVNLSDRTVLKLT